MYSWSFLTYPVYYARKSLKNLFEIECPVHDDCDGSESQGDEETDRYGAAGVPDSDLLTEEGFADGQVPLQLQQDQGLQVVQLHRQADSMEDTEVMVRKNLIHVLVAVFVRENHCYAPDQGKHCGREVVCLQHVTGLQVGPVSGENTKNYPGVVDGCTGHTEVADNLAMF